MPFVHHQTYMVPGTPTLGINNTWTGAAYNAGKFVIVGGNNTSGAYSTDQGLTWTSTTLPHTLNYSLIYAANRFVSVTNAGNVTAYSSDGVSWSSGSLPTTQAWLGIAYGNGIFVTVGSTSAGAATNLYATSTDGITWTSRTFPSSLAFVDVTFGNGKFVAIASGGTPRVSTDGITWTNGTLSMSGTESIAYGNGAYVAVSSNGQTAYSTDGVNWTKVTPSTTASWTQVAYGNGRFVVTAVNSNQVIYSDDNGVSWKPTTLPFTATYLATTYGTGPNSGWIAAGYDGSYVSKIAVSADGITWR